jgi:tryptophan synthase beta chain
VAYAIKTAGSLPEHHVMVVNLSGRGDKDLHTVAAIDNIKL